MEIERENAQKPLRKLRKTLKRLPSDPPAEDVHALRTHSRRLEAIVDALMLDRKKKTRQLLKQMTPMRKAAGDVRDMDVLVGNVLTLTQAGEDESLVRLVEHLGDRRIERARELHQTVVRNKKDARRSLKDYTKLVGKQFPGQREVMTNAASAPSDLATELANWPKLNADNIHPFRIKVKQLRYMLQLSGQVDKEIEAALGKVKDEVGDWHDWQELAGIAKQILDSRKDKTALKRIGEIGDGKFKQALAAANELRKQYFSNGWKGKPRKKRARKAKV